MDHVLCRLLFVLCFLYSSLFPALVTVAREKENTFFASGLRLLLLKNHGDSPRPGAAAHKSIQQWNGTSTCIACHAQESRHVFDSSHYQWLGKTPYMTNGPDLQGKLDLGVNSYCINTTGNWNGCGACHVGLGLRPQPVATADQLANIDCLICHQQEYKRIKVNDVFVGDESKMTISMLQAAQTVHLPTRVTCLQCHAKGGGGDNYKRGDMALAHGNTGDRNFDVHMAVSAANLSCQQCHITREHKMAGRGSDLRPTDLDVVMRCSQCHNNGHGVWQHNNRDIDNHLARVSCQACHIPTYAKNASDTSADERTEIHRDWLTPHPTASGAIHPMVTMAGNLVPKYAWWNGLSSSYLLFDQALIDPQTGKIPTSRPHGAVDEPQSKLFPFKYKTALQPLATVKNQLIALDTSVYFSTGDADAAVRSGLNNMNYAADTAYDWVETDTMQLISHEISPAARALRCNDCHNNTTRMDLVNSLGYGLKGTRQQVCTQCHDIEDGEDEPEYLWIHEEHVKDEGYDCSWCHGFSRPERGLEIP